MSPEERRLLTDLFDRVRNVSTTPRDREADDLIAQKIREQPYAAYYLAQAVLIQDQALQATTQRLQELEDQVHRLESEGSSGRSQSGGFLGSLGSIFGGSQPSANVPSRDTQREGRLYDDYARTNRYQEPEPEPAPSPWGRAGATSPWAQPAGMSQGGGFLRGALTTAAGVAGGVLAADAVRDLFSSHVGGTNTSSNSLFGDNRPDETVVNNYFLNDDKSNDRNDRDDRADRDTGGGSAAYDPDDNDDDDDFNVADFDNDDDSYA